MPYALPTDSQRRALFAWLKQSSSLTAWRRLCAYHQAFLDAVRATYEEEQRTAGMTLTIPTDWYTRVLDCHDAFNAAVARLSRSERRCFLYLGMRGHFSEALLAVRWWQQMYGGSFYGRNGFSPADSPRWLNIESPMHACLAALSDIGIVLQTAHTDVPAPIYDVNVLLQQPESSLIKHWISQPNLPMLPAVTPPIVVATGNIIPVYGIWEPVNLTRLSLARLTRAPADGLLLDGCMNYLHADCAAPTIAFPEDDARRNGRATYWRLVWADERYGSSAVPQEELAYSFIRPARGETLFSYA